MFHSSNSPFVQISLPNIIISSMRMAVKHHTTKYRFRFPHLLSFLFEQEGGDLEGIEKVLVKSLYEMNAYTLQKLSIRTDNIPWPRSFRVRSATQAEHREPSCSHVDMRVRLVLQLLHLHLPDPIGRDSLKLLAVFRPRWRRDLTNLMLAWIDMTFKCVA